MDKTLFPILIVISLAIIGVVGDFFIKLAGNGPRYIDLKWFILGLVIYTLTAFGWFYVMKHINLATLGVFYAISTVLFLTLISAFYFKEGFNIYEGMGIVFAIISLILLSRFA